LYEKQFSFRCFFGENALVILIIFLCFVLFW
jgi:hypothetical protein